jgi:hypothetical protein
MDAVTSFFEKYGLEVGAVLDWVLCVADLVIGFLWLSEELADQAVLQLNYDYRF